MSQLNSQQPVMTFDSKHSVEALHQLLDPQYRYGDWRCSYRFYSPNSFENTDAAYQVRAYCRLIPIFSHPETFTFYLSVATLDATHSQVSIAYSRNRFLEYFAAIMIFITLIVGGACRLQMSPVGALIAIALIALVSFLISYQRYYLQQELLKTLKNHLS